MIAWLRRRILGRPDLPPLPSVEREPEEQRRLDRQQRELEARVMALRYYRDHIARRDPQSS